MRRLPLVLLVMAGAILLRAEPKPSPTRIYPGCKLNKHLHHHEQHRHPPDCVWRVTCNWIMGKHFATITEKVIGIKEYSVTEFHIERCRLPHANGNAINLTSASLHNVQPGTWGNLKGLKIKDCKVIGIESNTFDSMTNLRWLSLLNTSITYLPGDAFSKLTKLKSLKLSQNILGNLTLQIGSHNLSKIELQASSLDVLRLIPTVRSLQLTIINAKDNNLTKIGGLSRLIGNDASIQLDGNPFDLSGKPFGQKHPVDLSYLSVSIWKEEDIDDLSDALGHFRSIDTLSVTNGSLPDNSNFTFQKLENMTIKTLEVLQFSNWWQYDTCYHPQINPYSSLKNIRELRLRDCDQPRFYSNDKKLRCFPNSSMTSLQSLSLNRADFDSLCLSEPRSVVMLDLSYGVSAKMNFTFRDGSVIKVLNFSCTNFETKLYITGKAGQSVVEELILRNISLIRNEVKPNETIWLSLLPKLRHIDLSANSDSYFPNVPFFTWIVNVKYAFFGLGNLEQLELNNTDIGAIDQDDLEWVFRPLKSLKKLDLDKSRFSSIPTDTFINQVNLEELHLAENELRAIAYSAFRTLVRLKHLDLRNNRIGYISGEAMARLTSLAFGTFLFTGNNFGCHCDFAQFTWWLKKNAFRPENQCELYNERCVVPISMKDKPILEYQPHWLYCDNNLLILTVSSFFSFLLIISTSVAIHSYRHRLSIRYWYVLQKMRRARSRKRINTAYGALDNNPDEPFDVFLSFEDNDKFWVEETLLPNLENSDDIRFRVCTVDRDLNDPGRPEVMNVAAGIRNSRNVIFVVTTEFVQTTWCEYEISLAETQSLQEGNCRLIIIFLEQFTWEELPLCLKRLLSHVNFLRWPKTLHEQKNFWRRLRLVILGEGMQSTTRVVYTQY